MDSKGKIPYEMLLNKKGRARLPDKLMDHLNDERLSDVIWWLPDGASFALDSKKSQEKLLDVYFRGTKLTSFIRSLNRWGFRRVFFHAMPRNAICFQCSQFKKGQPELLKDMKLAPTGSATSKSDRSPAGTGGGPSAAVASGGGQVDALFRQEQELQRRSQLGTSMASQVASLPSPLAMGSAGLSSLQQNANGVLGLSRAGFPANQIQFPGLPSTNASNPGRDQALLNAMVQREDLLHQLQREKQLQQRQQTLELQQRLQQQQQQTLDMQYVQSLFPPAAAASLTLPAGRQSLSQPHGVATSASAGRASIYASASARQQQGEFKQQSDTTGNQEAVNTALADFLRRRQNNNNRG